MLKKLLKKIGIFNILRSAYYSFKKHYKIYLNKNRSTGIVLLYHRIAEITQDPHQLNVSPENFRQQLTYLSKHYQIISSKQLVQDLRSKNIKNNFIVITFDDGYKDNFENALPILEELNIPATIFATTGNIDSDNVFNWEKDLAINNQGKSLSSDQIKNLTNHSLIEIGAHTVSHPQLSTLADSNQSNEIFDSKKDLEKITNQKIYGFAYPFGDINSFNGISVELVRKSGFKYAYSNIHERVTNLSNIYAIPRFVVRDWNTEEFKKNLNDFI